ncbi:hypothetical protein WH52_10505 [Tenacibaculum holothuriorum]|uniref:Porin n=1 Tax=Tenacibaculum holothuriorum TaxID=1635173 RepID=A0A1Y2PAY2_9FLAO|nr:hypothetical protein WH52_10505 [Tenacibaculum holothuriorum]
MVWLFLVYHSHGQIRTVDGSIGKIPRTTSGLDSLNVEEEIRVKLNGKTKWTDYKIISHKLDTTYIDTTLTIQKEYKFNFLRKDNFELLAFHNQGQAFNRLGYDFNETSLFPDIGFSGKQFGFIDINKVKYYEVPTPTTEIMYRTGIEQGQVLDALFTVNFSKRFNVGIAYKGLRSIGAYRNSLSSTGNFRLSYHYETLKGQYAIKGHFVNQDFSNQESGGLTTTSLEAFLNDDPNFSNNRGQLDVNLENAESLLEGKRIYFEQTFKLLSSKDSLNQKDFSNLKIGHNFTRESKFFRFIQPTLNTDFFGGANTASNINTKTRYLLYNNQLFLDFNSKYILGRFRALIGAVNYNYGYDTRVNPSVSAQNPVVNNELKGDAAYFGARWNAKINKFQLNAKATIIPGSGRLAGNNFHGEALYKKDSLFTVKAYANISSKAPNFNYSLYQSNYYNYNWQTSFENTEIRSLGGEFLSKWGNASLSITNIGEYVYFDENNAPRQASTAINYLKLKIGREFKFGKFALDNTLMYQNVSSGSSIFRVPEFVTRNTLYYTDYWFKGNPLMVQIGATFKYFSKYKANAYNPLLGEFTLQNTTDIGYPMLDVFFNGQVRRTRIYFKIENLSSTFLKKDYLSAPTYPYRDMSFRFGVVWNWFI